MLYRAPVKVNVQRSDSPLQLGLGCYLGGRRNRLSWRIAKLTAVCPTFAAENCR